MAKTLKRINKPSNQPDSRDDLIRLYGRGVRDFRYSVLDGFDLGGANLTAASFYCASMKGVNFEGAKLTYTQLKGANLRGATLDWASVNATDLIGADFVGASFRNADLTGAKLEQADCTDVDFSSAYLNNMSFGRTILKRIKLNRTKVSSVHFDDVELSAFCDARSLIHNGRSSIDATSVMWSYSHPNLKHFMLDCGVPEIFATYMIDCAAALGEPLLRKLMQSTFISYGGPDEAFARRLYDVLRAHRVMTFFFPESATLGERIDNEVFQRLQDHDRVLLVCSRDSLDRTGVIHEIQETLDREARDGGATYLLPIMLDDYVLDGWEKIQPRLAERIRRRIVGDFRGTKRNKARFDKAMDRVLDALKKEHPSLGADLADRT